MTYYCHQLWHHIEHSTFPDSWDDTPTLLTQERDHMERWLSKNTHLSLYGITTLPGHMDHTSIPAGKLAEFQRDLIENHHIGRAPFYDSLTARAIGYAKLQHISNGGTSIRASIFNHAKQTIIADDFTADIPMQSSYSCGDVIPAAHWSMAMLRYGNFIDHTPLRPKEGMSLINGSFVHAGVALALLPSLTKLLRLYRLSSDMHYHLTEVNHSNSHIINTKNDADPYLKAVQYIPNDSIQQKPIQDPTSVRCYPHILGSFIYSLEQFYQALDDALTRQSDNPLWDPNTEQMQSQGSFFDPLLSLCTGNLIEAILLLLWNVKERIHTTLNGEIDAIPENGATDDNPLGFIQTPKRITALLERARLTCGRRIFASGNSTSYGTEDIWSHGLHTAQQLSELTDMAIDMLESEATTYKLLEQLFKPTLSSHSLFSALPTLPNDYALAVETLSIYLQQEQPL